MFYQAAACTCRFYRSTPARGQMPSWHLIPLLVKFSMARAALTAGRGSSRQPKLKLHQQQVAIVAQIPGMHMARLVL